MLIILACPLHAPVALFSYSEHSFHQNDLGTLLPLIRHIICAKDTSQINSKPTAGTDGVVQEEDNDDRERKIVAHGYESSMSCFVSHDLNKT